MTILALGTYYGHLVHMMPFLEVISKARNARVVYCSTMEAADIPFTRFFSESVMEEFLSKERVVTGRPGYWGSELLRLVRDLRPDAIFWWNGLAYGEIVRAILEKHVPILYCEMGYLPQKGHLYVDHRGINALSSIRYRESRSVEPWEEEKVHRMISDFRQREANSEGEAVPEGPYIFVPLQSEIDTQITKFSPVCPDMFHLVSRVLDAFPHQKIVVKPHPVQPKVHLPSSNFLVRSDAPTARLIAEAEAVIGINSTVLTEALVANKPVAALGLGVFSGRNVMLECHEQWERMREVKEFRADPAALRTFLVELLCRSQIRTGIPDDEGVIRAHDINAEEAETFWQAQVEPYLTQPVSMTFATILEYRLQRLWSMIATRSLHNRL